MQRVSSTNRCCHYNEGRGGEGVGEEEGFRVIHAPLIPERRRMEMLTQLKMLGNVRRDYHDAEPVEDIVDPVRKKERDNLY